MRRSRLEIIRDILRVANGAKKTHIMYRANLSFKQTEDYLSFLEEIDFIKKGSEYKLLERGIEYLKGYGKIERLITKNSFDKKKHINKNFQ